MKQSFDVSRETKRKGLNVSRETAQKQNVSRETKSMTIQEAVMEYRRASTAIKEAEKTRDVARDTLLSALQERGVSTLPVKIGKVEFTVSMRTVRTVRIDTNRVKVAFPETWERDFGIISESPRLTIK